MKVVVIGGGAAGMMAAVTAAQFNNDVVLLEKNEKLGKKMYITGKGRCNLTNDCDFDEFISNVVTNPKFLYSALRSFQPSDTMEFFVSSGLRLKTERGNRVFPLSDKSSDVIKALAERLKASGVKVVLGQKVTGLNIEGGKVISVSTETDEFACDKVIVATGGVSYSSTGSTGDGYDFARAAGHTVLPPKPALSPINTKYGYASLAGLSLKNVTLKLFVDGKLIRSEFGEMLFTHTGISGPIVLTVSSLINKYDLNKVGLKIDFKPALTAEQLDKRILRDFSENGTKQIKNAFDALLPRRMTEAFIAALKIDKFKKINLVTKEERAKIVEIMKNFPVDEIRMPLIDQAIVTCGGVSVSEIDPKTMRSKKCENLYFAGEVMDVDALTGGFNLQIAFATGVAAGKNEGEIC